MGRAPGVTAQGLAQAAVPAEGGRTCWHIARRYDLRLAAGAAGATYIAPKLEHFTVRQRDLAYKRAAAVERYRTARARWDGNQGDWLPGLCGQLSRELALSVSPRTLWRWHGLYRSPADLVRLIDQRGGNQRGAADPAAWDYFRGVYLDPRQPTIKTAWRCTRDQARAEGWTWCSYAACRRQLDQRISPQQQAAVRDPKLFRSRYEPSIDQDPEAYATGEVWIGDHCQLDMVCRIQTATGPRDLRPWLTAWMDWRSRRVVGWCLSDAPNASTILAALRAAISDQTERGFTQLPAAVWIDNGKDYDCYTFHGQTKAQRKRRVTLTIDETRSAGLFNLLGVEAHFSIPHNPNGKSRLERWFGVLHDQFDRTFETYTGATTDAKPEDLARLLREGRHTQSFDHVRQRIGRFVAGKNMEREHARADMAGQSADDLMAAAPLRRQLADPAALELLLAQWHEPVRVGKHGVAISILGQRVSYGRFDAALGAFKRPAGCNDPRWLVHVCYDPNDDRRVRVFDYQFKFVTEAARNDLGGGLDQDATARRHRAELNREKAAYRRSLKHAAGNRKFEYLSDAELLAEKAAAERNPPSAIGDRQSPDVLHAVQTPLDGAARQLQTRRLRRAAGAEVVDAIGADAEGREADGPGLLDTDLSGSAGSGSVLNDLAWMARKRGSRYGDDDDPLSFDLSAGGDEPAGDTDMVGDTEYDTDVVLDLDQADALRRPREAHEGRLLDEMP